MGRGIFAERDVKQGETITKCERFQASKDIKKGEHLLIDYRTDVEGLSGILEKYTTSLI